ncbi:hypothetical protein Ddc_10534 [Ditylenchus destructor]|nr:hypothetical protein Ddc_10534 [Ditylenchus destructor]
MASREAELLYAVKNNDLKTVISCYETGVKATEVDKDSNNILHVAAAAGNVLMVRAVLMFYCLDGSLLADKNNKGQVPASVTDNELIRADIHKVMSGPRSGSMWESYCMQTTVATAKPWLDSPWLDMPLAVLSVSINSNCPFLP